MDIPLNRFIRTSVIPIFGRANFTLPVRRRSYNDDIRSEAYRPADLTYAGQQRNGIRERLYSRHTFAEHILEALEESFPFASETHLPYGAIRTAIFPMGMLPGHPPSFQGRSAFRHFISSGE